MNEVPAPRRGRPPGREGTGTKERIRQAVIDLFAANGFHGTGVSDIADRVGIQRGALYYHIQSKEELLWEVLGGYVRDTLDGIEAIVADELDPVSTFRRLMRHHVERIVAHRREVAIHVRDASALSGERAAQFQALRDRVQRRWQEVVDECHRTGAFASADHVLVNGILGMVNMVFLWYQEGGNDSPGQIADKLTEMILHGLERHHVQASES